MSIDMHAHWRPAELVDALRLRTSDPRVFRNDERIRWQRPVHEQITGCKTYSHIPPQEELSLYHPKTIHKQETQNQLYTAITMDNYL